MNRSSRAISRAHTTAGLAAVVFTAGWLTGTPMAAAHVSVDAADAVPGGSAVLTFRVPGESETGALTTQFSVTLPGGTSARTELMPGWKARVDREATAGTVRSVTWTAEPGVGVSPDQFALFRVSVTLPDSASVSFPATQTYSDGTVVRWDEPALPDGSEPEHPAPVLSMDGAPQHDDAHHVPSTQASAAAPSSRSDITARWLAGAGLLVGAAGVALALLSRRRS